MREYVNADGWEREVTDPRRLTTTELEDLVPDEDLDDETWEDLVAGEATPADLRAARIRVLLLRREFADTYDEGPRARWGLD